MKSYFIGLIAALLATGTANAATTFGDWSTAKQKNGRCVAMANATNSIGNISGRTAPYVAIMNSPAEGIKESVSMVSGTDKTGAGTVKIDIDGKNFDALIFKNAAFVGSGKPEAELIAAMDKGTKLTIRWATKDGESVADTYSLQGFVDARREIQHCN